MRYRTLSIVIPVYNEEHTVLPLIQSVKKANVLQLKKQIIVVDDASTDNTHKILRKITGITLIKHSANRGKGAALRTGFLQAIGDIVLIQDADLEYSPKDYPKLLTPFFESGADAVYGSRFRGGEATRVIYFTHFLANYLLTFYSNLWTNINLTDMECGYKVFSKWVIDDFKNKLVSNHFGIEPEITARLSHLPKIKVYEVGITYQGRTYEEGKKISFIDGLKAIFQITRFNFFRSWDDDSPIQTKLLPTKSRKKQRSLR